jgi:hypothetical protein
MGLYDVRKQQIRDRAPELKQTRRRVRRADAEGHGRDWRDPDEIVGRVQQTPGEPLEQDEQRIQKVMQRVSGFSPEHQRELIRCGRGCPHIPGCFAGAYRELNGKPHPAAPIHRFRGGFNGESRSRR